MLFVKDKGYNIWHAPHLADCLNTSDLIFDESNDDKDILPINRAEEVSNILKILHAQIGQEFLCQYVEFYTTLTPDIRINAKKGSRYFTWHTDADEPSDLFFLLYFNDMQEVNEGAIWVRNIETGTSDRILPKYGDLVVIKNDDPKYEHKAEYTNYRRVVACFDFVVKKWKH